MSKDLTKAQKEMLGRISDEQLQSFLVKKAEEKTETAVNKGNNNQLGLGDPIDTEQVLKDTDTITLSLDGNNNPVPTVMRMNATRLRPEIKVIAEKLGYNMRRRKR